VHHDSSDNFNPGLLVIPSSEGLSEPVFNQTEKVISLSKYSLNNINRVVVKSNNQTSSLIWILLLIPAILFLILLILILIISKRK